MTAGAAETLGAGYETLSDVDFDVFQANTEKYIDAVRRVYVVGAHSESGQVRICPNLSEKSPTVNKDSRSGSDTRRGLRDLI